MAFNIAARGTWTLATWRGQFWATPNSHQRLTRCLLLVWIRRSGELPFHEHPPSNEFTLVHAWSVPESPPLAGAILRRCQLQGVTCISKECIYCMLEFLYRQVQLLEIRIQLLNSSSLVWVFHNFPIHRDPWRIHIQLYKT